MENAVVTLATVPAEQTTDMPSLFGEEAPSATDLGGPETPAPKPVEPPPPTVAELGGEEPPVAKPAEKPADPPPVEKKDKGVLLGEPMSLEELLPPATPKFDPNHPRPDFKILTDAEFDALANDDPVEAVKYNHRLRLYQERLKRYREVRAEGERKLDNIEAREKAGYAETVAACDEVVPGLFKEGSKDAQELTDIALAAGMKEHVLDSLTDPATRVLVRSPHGWIVVPAKEVVLGMTKLLAELRKAKGGGKVQRLETNRSSKEDKEVDVTKPISEAAFKKLSPEKQKAYLGG